MADEAARADARPGRDPQSGVVAVWVAIFMIPIAIILAMSLNMGILMETKTELQLAADATALAAVRSLDGTMTGINAARIAADNYSSAHTAFGETVVIDTNGADLAFGNWDVTDCASNCFSELDPSDPDTNLRDINAVRIMNGRDAAHGAPVPFIFSGLLGVASGNVSATAIAVGGGPASAECPMPFTLAECVAVNPLNNQIYCNDGPHRFVFSNESDDGMGFVNLYGGQPTPPNTAAIIRGGCQEGSIGDAQVQNGNSLNQQIISALRGVPQGNTSSPCRIGQTLTFPVVRLDCPGGDPEFRDEGSDGRPVVGFIRATLTEVVDNNGDVQRCHPQNSTVRYADNALHSSLVLEISCEEPDTSNVSVGGTFFNTGTMNLRLVQ